MEFLRSSSFAIGICIGLIFCVIIFRFANRNKKLKSEYDERQLQIRGRSYMFAFYAVVIYEALMTCLSIGRAGRRFRCKKLHPADMQDR